MFNFMQIEIIVKQILFTSQNWNLECIWTIIYESKWIPDILNQTKQFKVSCD